MDSWENWEDNLEDFTIVKDEKEEYKKDIEYYEE